MATNNDFVIEFIAQIDKAELNKELKEFTGQQIEIKVNTDNLKKAIKEFTKEFKVQVSDREITAWTKKFIKSQKDAQEATKQRLEDERQRRIELARITQESIDEAIQGILAETDAQTKLNQTTREMQQNITTKDVKQLQIMTNEYNKIGKQIKNITDNNVGFLKGNKQIASQVQDIVSEFEQLGRTLVSGDVDSSATALENLRGKVDGVTSSIRQAKSQSQSFGQMLKDNATKFGMWSMITVAYFQVVRGIKDAINEVIELDTSLVELRKVTNLSGSALEDFTQDAFEAGREVGRTGKEVIDATAEFARSGYTIKESLELGTEALKLRNVADGIESTSESALVLISVLKAYKMEASEASQITDILNEVSNNAAIGFADLAEGNNLQVINKKIRPLCMVTCTKYNPNSR